MNALVTGATGFVGKRLALELLARGMSVRCLVRDPSRAEDLRAAGAELAEGDVLDADSLRGIGRDVDIAYYLVHSMGRGSGGDYASRDRQAAANFARAMRADAVERVVYLGGLGDQPKSEHLRSRHETAGVLAAEGPPLTYFRAAMVAGPESESFRTLRYLVARLPVMIAPSWLQTPTQPIAVDDVIAYLAQAPSVPESRGREIQIGGPDVMSYGDMLDVTAEALGVRRRPRLPVPFLSPTLSALWIGLVTPVDKGVAKPLVEGLSTPTVVTDPAGASLFDVRPTPFAEAMASAVAADG